MSTWVKLCSLLAIHGLQALKSFQFELPSLESRGFKLQLCLIAYRESIRANYEAMEAEKTKFLLASQKQEVVIRTAETAGKKLKIEAQQKLEISKIEMQKKLDEQKKLLELSLIDNEILKDHAKVEAQAEIMRAEKQCQGNKNLLTEDYQYLSFVESLSYNSKLVLGDKIPSSLLSNILEQEQRQDRAS
jgi:hypothetical protein